MGSSGWPGHQRSSLHPPDPTGWLSVSPTSGTFTSEDPLALTEFLIQFTAAMRDLAGNQRYTADIELNCQTTTRPESRLIRVILDNWAGADEDTDGDELWDGLEVRYSCLDPLVPDAEVDHDMDGLTTAKELFTTFQSDPCDPDFDDDGVLDSSDNCPFLFCEIA